MPEPLPMCRELAEQVEGEWSGEIGHVDRDAARIDARVRPLVALYIDSRSHVLTWLARNASAEKDPQKRATFIEAHNAVMTIYREYYDATLKAAGAE